MKFSTLNEAYQSREMVESFGGYNHNLRIAENEFYDMTNLSPDYLPAISPRKRRGTYAYAVNAGVHNPNGLIAKDALCYVDGITLYINNYAVTGLTLTNGPKQLISMGAYLIIMPDKKYVNTKDLTDKGDIEATWKSSGTVTYELCRVDGSEYEEATASATEPSNPSHMMLWIDTSQNPHVLKQYSETTAMWVSIATTYIKIKAAGIASAFSQYDGVKISGIDPELEQLQDLEGQVSALWDAYHDEDNSGAGDYIVVIGILDSVSTQTDTLTLERKMPNLDFVIESENRLWGCRYGTALDGSIVNEIYASKLGDFKNWNVFMGLSSDSYVASCGTDGPFTGAIAHLGYPLFFKEDCLHKVYGNFPSNFQIQTTACKGVQKGAGKSLAIVNERLYYKSRNGVCVYDGSLPAEISSAFGDIHYTGVDSNNTDALRNGAVAGSNKNRYYISMKSEVDNTWNLFLYDTATGLWFREDNTRADDFCSCDGKLYFTDHDTSQIRIADEGSVQTESLSWSAETGVLGMGIPDKEYVSRILIRMTISTGHTVNFYLEYDSSGTWESAGQITGTTMRSFVLPIRPKRCDHFRLKMTGSGAGNVKIHSIVKTIEQGSDWR